MAKAGERQRGVGRLRSRAVTYSDNLRWEFEAW
jgi:hypothetical protein